jgi:SAM-dependent methyltransferase
MKALCPACGSRRSRAVWAIGDCRFRRCRDCSTLWVENPPDQATLDELYADESYFENPSFGETDGYRGYLDYLADSAEIEAKFAKVLAHLEAQVEIGRLLDVGAGPGLLVAAARRRGWDASGIDMNPWAAAFARDELGVEVRVAGADDALAEPASLDALTMMDLVEHLADPGQAVGAAARAVRPGGVIAVLTPDAGASVSRALGRRWPEAIRAPEHLTLFSARGLARLLAGHGFETIGVHSVGKESTIGTLAADIAPVAPRTVGVAKRVLGAVGLDRRTIEFDPRTKFCLYARRADGGVESPPKRPPRLPKRPPEAPPAQAVLEDLRALAGAGGLTSWMFEQYATAVGPRVAEVGSGIGTFSERLLAAGAERLLLIEPDADCAAALRERFGADDRVEVSVDEVPGSAALAARAGSLDLIVCQNVLEHIDDDAGAVAEMAAALRPGGRLALLVPADPRLYGALDLAYGHRRRYTRDRIERVLGEAGLAIERLEPFNLLGVPGWWASNRLRRTGIDRRALRVYEAVLPAAKRVEEAMNPQFALSLVALARRREEPG